MSKLNNLLAALAVAVCAQAAPPEIFSQAKFGIRIESDVLPVEKWMNRIADSGARYVATTSPNAHFTRAAEECGLFVTTASGNWHIGQLVPPGPMSAPLWEAGFEMTDGSGGTTSRELIRLLIETVSKGGNLLLKLPPKPDDGLQALEEIGQWLKVNGESIYGAGVSPFDQMPFFGRATAKGNVLYVHLFQWPASRKLSLAGLQNKIVSAELLGATEILASSGAVVELPPSPPYAAASVIKLTLDGPPKAAPYLIGPDSSGLITAGVQSCEFRTRDGQVVRKENRKGRVFLSHWTRAIDVPIWKVHVPRSGRYGVEMVYSAGPESAGVAFTVTVKGSTMGMVKGIVEATGPASRKVRVSDMELDADSYVLSVQPENKKGQPAMELEAVILHRIGD